MGDVEDDTVEVIEEALGRRVECVGSFKVRGPDLAGPFDGAPLHWIAEWLWRRPRRRLPSPVELALTADGRVHAVQLRWAPMRVHQVIESWSLADVGVVARSGWEVGDGIDAVDLVLPDATVPLRVVDVRDPGTRDLLARLGAG